MAISIPHLAEVPHRLLVGRLRWVALVAAVTVALAALLTLSTTSAFHARRIDVTGSSALSRAQVTRLSGLGLRTNVLWLDEAAAERRLEANPWVADADVSVALPFTIEISLLERSPVAMATDGLSSVLVAADGTVLGTASGRAGARRSLPVIELVASGLREGTAASPVGAAMALGAMDAELRESVARVSVLLNGSLEVWMRSGLVVRYGAPTRLESKARAISRILAWAGAEGEEIIALSVVAPGAPAATLAP